jgi:hypothetical protein
MRYTAADETFGTADVVGAIKPLPAQVSEADRRYRDWRAWRPIAGRLAVYRVGSVKEITARDPTGRRRRDGDSVRPPLSAGRAKGNLEPHARYPTLEASLPRYRGRARH